MIGLLPHLSEAGPPIKEPKIAPEISTQIRPLLTNQSDTNNELNFNICKDEIFSHEKNSTTNLSQSKL